MCEAVMLWRWPDNKHEPPVAEHNGTHSATFPIVPYWHWNKCSPYRKTLWVKTQEAKP